MTKDQRKRLHAAILSGFDLPELTVLVRHELDERLDVIVWPGERCA